MNVAKFLLHPTLTSGLVLGLILGQLTPAQAGLDFLSPVSLNERIRKEVAKASVRGSLNLIDAEVYDGISAAIKYRMQSDPSYVDSYYTRLDKYTLTADINPGDILEENDSPVGFSINKNAEVIFARQFKSQKASITAMPYNLKHIPLSAKNAINNLEPGDFVALEGRLSFVLSAGTSSFLQSLSNSKGGTHFYISGEFLIHLFRMPNNKMRVKLIAVRDRGAAANVQVGKGLDVVGLNVIDRQIKKFLHITPADLGIERKVGDYFLLDYVFDLNNPQAVDAYEKLLTKKTQFKDLQVINPSHSDDEMRAKLVNDLSEVEDIAYQDRELPKEQRRIDRVFKGSNEASTSESRFKVGIGIFKIDNRGTFGRSNVIYTDRNNQETPYILDTFTKSESFKMMMGLFGDEKMSGSNILFSSDREWNPVKFVALTIFDEAKIRNLSANDFKRIQEKVKLMIPASEYANIDWKNWDFSRGDVVNAYFKSELFFHPASIKAIPNLKTKDLHSRFLNYVIKTGLPKYEPTIPSPYGKTYGPAINKYEYDIRAIAGHLETVFNPLTKPTKRYESFKAMNEFNLWKEKGGSFLISLIPVGQQSQLLSYQMVLSARGVDTVKVAFGNFQQEELYKSLMYIQNIINDRSFDLRLFTDMQETTLKVQ